MEEVELVRAGLAGGAWVLGPEALLVAGVWLALMGDFGTCVGVGSGVAWAEGVVELLASPVCPVYGCPSSPGANDNAEQKPSEELMIKVKPSLDLYLFRRCDCKTEKLTYQVKSVKVAKCRLLTTQRGVCCCVS